MGGSPVERWRPNPVPLFLRVTFSVSVGLVAFFDLKVSWMRRVVAGREGGREEGGRGRREGEGENEREIGRQV